MTQRISSFTKKAFPIITNFSDYLTAAAARINPVLKNVLDGWSDEVQQQAGPRLNDAASLLQGSVGGGKMLRGALVMLGYELAGATSGDIARPAAAFELLHSGLLIHDDIMDNAALRRGRPAVHLAAGGGYANLSQAINLGDAGFFMAHRLMSEAKFEAALLGPVMARFSQIALDTIAGQMLDVELSRPGAQRSEAEVLRIHELKSARYTVVGPLTTGAMLAGATGQLLDALEQFGRHIGIAFQIHDDILGVFGEDGVTGKPNTSDISENKSTLLIVYALEHADPGQLKILQQHYGHPVMPAEAARVRQVFKDCGSLEYSRGLAKRHVADGLAATAGITSDPAMCALLSQFAEFSINRSH